MSHISVQSLLWVSQREWCSPSFPQFTAAKQNRSKTECTARKSRDHTLPFQKLPRSLFIKVYFNAPEPLIPNTVLLSFQLVWYHENYSFYWHFLTLQHFNRFGINKKIVTRNLLIVPTYKNVFIRTVLKKPYSSWLKKRTHTKKNHNKKHQNKTRHKIISV